MRMWQEDQESNRKVLRNMWTEDLLEMNSTELATWIRELIDKDELWKFYKSKDWIRLKTTILQMNHYECYECRRRGKITRFDTDAEGNKKLISTVHHVHHVKWVL